MRIECVCAQKTRTPAHIQNIVAEPMRTIHKRSKLDLTIDFVHSINIVWLLRALIALPFIRINPIFHNISCNETNLARIYSYVEYCFSHTYILNIYTSVCCI